MNLDLILKHPFGLWDPMLLIKTGGVLPTAALGPTTEWSDAISRTIRDDGWTAPRESLTIMRGTTTSLATLAEESLAFIQEDYENFSAREYEGPVALFLGMELILRRRSPLDTSLAEAQAIAKKNGWKTVEDVTASLLVMENKLVQHGKVVLRLEPSLRAEFVADDDDRSYDDTHKDIRRRLDYIGSDEFKPLFDDSKRTAKLVLEAETLSREANMFRQSREAKKESGVKATLRRNVFFTAWTYSLSLLQDTLRGALADDHPDLLDRVESRYWRSLASMSRKVRKPDMESLEEDTEEELLDETADGADPEETPA